MIIIKCNVMMNTDQFMNLYEGFVGMARSGVVLLPPYCELLNEVPPDTEVVVVKGKE